MKHMLTMICASVAGLSLSFAQAGPTGIDVAGPKAGSVVDTPLSATLLWSPVQGASTYGVDIVLAGKRKPIVSAAGIKETRFRVALRPATSYKWTVYAVDAGGSRIAKSEASRFSTPEPVLKEITDNNVLFDGMFPNAHWVEMKPVPAGRTPELSPWFDKKRFDAAPPPKMEQVKDRLPEPIWDGHQDAIDMYWYAWKTLFSVWLYAPPGKEHMAVSNVVGMPTWAGWGSTMVLDTAFILQFARYGDAAYPFITSLDNCYARQHENGFICRETENNNYEVLSGWPVNPNLLPWAEWSYYKVTGDVGRLRTVFLPLVKQYEWYMTYQRRANGAYWTNGLNESDDLTRNLYAHSFISTTCVQAMAAEQLSQMAGLLGRKDLQEWFAGQHAELKDLVNARFWDAKHHLYNDLNTDEKPITVTPDGLLCKHWHSFWPLLTGVATEERAGYLEGQLANTKTFCRTSGVASLSADSFGYNAENGAYWRGAVWPPVQCVVVQGLRRAGDDKLAHQLAERYYNAFLTAFKSKGDITEFLGPEKPEMYGCGSFVGWGGVAPIEFLIEEILGIKANAPTNTVEWTIRLPERHGIRNLRFGGHTVSLICEPAGGNIGPRKITVESDNSFTLVLKSSSGVTTHRIRKGRTEIR